MLTWALILVFYTDGSALNGVWGNAPVVISGFSSEASCEAQRSILWTRAWNGFPSKLKDAVCVRVN